MRVLFAVSECAPFVKTGGLADVAGALPKALAAEGVAVRVLIPAYPAVAQVLGGGKALGEVEAGPAGRARILGGRAAGLELLTLDAPALFDRSGGPYLGPDGADWPDNHLRFGALSRAAAEIARGGLGGWTPDVLHVHDWQTALAPAYLRPDPRPGPPTVLTIHNIAFQGLFGPDTLSALGLAEEGFTPGGFEFWGRVGFLKAGLVHADRITTVSPTYARELADPAFGMGLEGVVAARRADVEGVLNGVDPDIWNPATDPHLAVRYGPEDLAGRAGNRRALAERLRLAPRDDAPVFGVVSRLTRQKGFDLLLEALPRLLARGACLAALGSGERDLEWAFAEAGRAHPGRVGAVIGYDEALSHLIQGGADSILVPSRFEPCGLTQLYALRYGAPPVVARTGGLADTVVDANEAALATNCATGFQFAPVAAGPLADALDRACDAFADRDVWTGLQRRGMAHPVGWEASARRYATLYGEVVERRRGAAA